MGTQLYLPAGWARRLESRLDPVERLAELEKDRTQAKGDIREINEWAINGRWPDLVILIDTPPEVLERRMRGRQLDRFERENDGFHERVRDGFRTMALADPEHWVVIDGGAGMEEVGSSIRRSVAERLHL